MRNTKVRALRRLFRAILREKNATATKKDIISPEKSVTLWKRFKRSYIQGKVIIPQRFHDKNFHNWEN